MSARVWLLRRERKRLRRLCYPGLSTADRAWWATRRRILQAGEERGRRRVKVWLVA